METIQVNYLTPLAPHLPNPNKSKLAKFFKIRHLRLQVLDLSIKASPIWNSEFKYRVNYPYSAIYT
jgi:hypothetical protein